ncbi:PREDICTED: ribosomal L1 domain-containing protein 1 [Crocodylus porosus]|uniref:ribosomal L1 domain-containing protein 1 n=1 Tax=Crocodylus porosus TaxID=8502 RepID=UPI00093B1A2F|nr:PREDICTED: ribosomal L1 domain-containing protein 1 [Crocodylus porosus]
MAEPVEGLDRAQVRKAVQALLAYVAARASAEKPLLGGSETLYLMVTVWKIPPLERSLFIPLPHVIRPETSEICLFTKDEPELSAEQTENLYKKLLQQNGITNISQIISYKTLTQEYKPYEAKRRLLNKFDLFLSDDRIRRLLPSHLGKVFYRNKRTPLSVNLKAKDLAREINKYIRGTILPVTNKGCCYTARIGHTGMGAEELLENIVAAVGVIADKLPKKGKNIKVLHLKTTKSVALPIFNSPVSNLDELEKQPSAHRKDGQKKKVKKQKRMKAVSQQTPRKAEATPETSDAAASAKEPEMERKRKAEVVIKESDNNKDDEDVPQLVPIQTAGVNGQENAEPNRSPKKGGKTRNPLGKRKMTVQAQETPKTKLKLAEGADLQTLSHQKQGKKQRTPKNIVKDKELKETPKKLEAKSATSKGSKLIKSVEKAPKTPRRTPRKMKVPCSA